MNTVFDYSVLDLEGHRPYPLPQRSWLMTQTWSRLLFMHWEVDPQLLRSQIPDELELDTFEGKAWLGIVPFYMSNIRVRGLPKVPGHSAFLELNVRTYVKRNGISGVYFFSLDAENFLAVKAARGFYHLPYYHALMSLKEEGNVIDYKSERLLRSNSFRFSARYRPEGEVFRAAPGTFDHFLCERYCLFTVRKGKVYRGDIHHAPWPLQKASCEIESNSMSPLFRGSEFNAPVLHYADKLDVFIWPIEQN